MNALPAVVLCVFVLSGCSSTERLGRFVVLGSESVATMRDAPSETVDVRVEASGFKLDGAKQEIAFTFRFSRKTSLHLRSVRVDDISDSVPRTVIVDSSPRLSSDGMWSGIGIAETLSSPALTWLHMPGDTLRRYRYVITTTDREIVVHQSALWLERAKVNVRTSLRKTG